MKEYVDIIIPVYNCENEIRYMFDSLLSQTYRSIRIIAVDDGSTDNSLKVISDYQRKFRLLNIELSILSISHQGQAAALQAGLLLVSGDYLLLLDADDYLNVDYILNMVEMFRKNSDLAFCYPIAMFIKASDGSIENTMKEREERNNHSFFEDVLYIKDIFFPGYMYRMTCLERVLNNRKISTAPGGQNAQLMLPMSWEYGNPVCSKKSLYFYRVREESHSHSINTPIKAIRQIDNYQRIVSETLDLMIGADIYEWKQRTEKHYDHLRFGNALDSRDIDMIKKYFWRYIEHSKFDLKSWELFIYHVYFKNRLNAVKNHLKRLNKE